MKWNLVWFLLCCLGFTVHTYYVSQMYFKRHVVSVTSAHYPSHIIAPAISICFKLGDIYDSKASYFFYNRPLLQCEQASQLSNRMEPKPKDEEVAWNEANKGCYREMAAIANRKHKGNVTVVMERLLYNFSEIVENISYLNFKKNEYIDVDNIRLANLSMETFSMTNKPVGCYKVSLNIGCGGKKARSDLKYNDLLIPYLKIQFKSFDDMTDVEIFIHPRDVLPLADESHFVMNSNSTYEFGYRAFERSYDTKYYRQQCENYGNGGRAHQLAKCLENAHRDRSLSAAKACEKEYAKADCSFTSYEPVVMKDEYNEKGLLKVGIILESKVTRTCLVPKTTLGEFIAYLFGIAGFWFGFNLVTVLDISNKVAQVHRLKAGRPMVKLN
ncbi:hypothetical protein HDE_12112 [Halotydeus destructor]|nr:hypothetical protein HDE_12112 [Halotydeus destructor]